MKKIFFAALFFGLIPTLFAQKFDASMLKTVRIKPNVNKNFLSDQDKLKLVPLNTTKVSSVSKKVTVGIVSTTDPSVTLSALNAFIVTKEYMRLNANGVLIFIVSAPEKAVYTYEINLDVSANKGFTLNYKENGQQKEQQIQPTLNKLQFTLTLDKGDNSLLLSAKSGSTETWDYINAQISKVN